MQRQRHNLFSIERLIRATSVVGHDVGAPSDTPPSPSQLPHTPPVGSDDAGTNLGADSGSGGNSGGGSESPARAATAIPPRLTTSPRIARAMEVKVPRATWSEKGRKGDEKRHRMRDAVFEELFDDDGSQATQRQLKAGTLTSSEWKMLINIPWADDLCIHGRTAPGVDTEETGDDSSVSGGDDSGSRGKHTVFLDLTGDPSASDSSHEDATQRETPSSQGSGLHPVSSRSMGSFAATEWRRFVPKLYYLHAENILDQYERDQRHPEFWTDLVVLTQGGGDILLLGSGDDEEVGNEKRDTARTSSKKEDAKSAQMERPETEVQEREQDENVQDDDEEKTPSTQTQQSKRRSKVSEEVDELRAECRVCSKNKTGQIGPRHV
ncbi:hypothetical protein ON010_g8794 [Phytophthora cinnamomi]|nr:hypothetical protein ON010_g8794 [Phytophthora cinnamomi]